MAKTQQVKISKVEAARISLSDLMLYVKDINFEELFKGSLLLLIFSGNLILCMQRQHTGQPSL